MFFHLIKKLLGNTSLSLIVVIVFSLLLGHKLPYSVVSFFYAISLTIKEILLFILPLVIFTYLASCILSLRQGAFMFILILVGMVIISNFLSILTGYLAHVGQMITVSTRSAETAIIEGLIPYWMISFPKHIANDQAMFFGLIIGLFFSYKRSLTVEKIINSLKSFVNFFMNRIFAPILPLFILGFVLKLKYEGNLGEILQDYTPVLGVIVILQICYLFVMYIFAARFNFSLCLRYMKEVLPAVLAGFSAMSSAAAMPLSVRAAEKNTGDVEMARAVIPATLNIHMIGDSIAISIIVLIILKTFGFQDLSFYNYLVFTGYFMIAKFAVAAIPGGTIIVMVPVLEAQIGFNAEMSALGTALYILFDPIITAANVAGNGAFAVLFNRIMKYWQTPRF